MRTATAKHFRLSERAVTAQIIGTKKAPGFMRVEGWDCIRLQSGTVRGATRGTFMRLGEDGLPDWVCVRGLQYVFLELKASDGRLRPAQIAWHEHAVRRGYPVMVANGLGSFMQAYYARWPK